MNVRVLLSSDFVKKLSSSHFNYWAGYVVNFSLVGWLLSYGFRQASALNLSAWILLALFGLAFWTFAEYLLHRFAYHEVESVLRVGHSLHHDEPKSLLGVPWYLTTVVLVAVFYGFSLIFQKGGLGVSMGFFWLGYIGYCAVHHSIHHFNFKNSWFQKIRRHHLIHHAKNDINWGLTTIFWDKVFKTFQS